MDGDMSGAGTIREIMINGVTEHMNIISTCSPKSYYECLAKRFLKTDFKLYDSYLTINGSRCEFKEICSPFTLPSVDGRIIPVCEKDMDRDCFGKIISDLRTDQGQYCLRSCLIKEYQGKSEELFIHDDECSNEWKNEVRFRLTFSLPKALHNHRSEKLLKTVMTEYWIVSSLSLIGTVGGTLGMFVGFSIMGTSEWLLTALAKGFRLIRGKCKKIIKRNEVENYHV